MAQVPVFCCFDDFHCLNVVQLCIAITATTIIASSTRLSSTGTCISSTMMQFADRDRGASRGRRKVHIYWGTGMPVPPSTTVDYPTFSTFHAGRIVPIGVPREGSENLLSMPQYLSISTGMLPYHAWQSSTQRHLLIRAFKSRAQDHDRMPGKSRWPPAPCDRTVLLNILMFFAWVVPLPGHLLAVQLAQFRLVFLLGRGTYSSSGSSAEAAGKPATSSDNVKSDQFKRRLSRYLYTAVFILSCKHCPRVANFCLAWQRWEGNETTC